LKNYLFFLLLLFPVCYCFSEGNTPFDIEPGCNYVILDYSVNIREQPNQHSRVIGQLQLHDYIDVIENMGNAQTIAGVTQNWYRIKFSNIEGYIWGGYIAVGSAGSFDIDNNGVDDYFYTRFSDMDGNIPYLPPMRIFPHDIFIYINGKRVSTTAFEGLTVRRGEIVTHVDYFGYYISLGIFNPNELEIGITVRVDGGAWETTNLKFVMDRNGAIRFRGEFMYTN
jgi:hypothetical protein